MASEMTLEEVHEQRRHIDWFTYLLGKLRLLPGNIDRVYNIRRCIADKYQR